MYRADFPEVSSFQLPLALDHLCIEGFIVRHFLEAPVLRFHLFMPHTTHRAASMVSEVSRCMTLMATVQATVLDMALNMV